MVVTQLLPSCPHLQQWGTGTPKLWQSQAPSSEALGGQDQQ